MECQTHVPVQTTATPPTTTLAAGPLSTRFWRRQFVDRLTAQTQIRSDLRDAVARIEAGPAPDVRTPTSSPLPYDLLKQAPQHDTPVTPLQEPGTDHSLRDSQGGGSQPRNVSGRCDTGQG